jgi:membrane-associated phospholipid phosphatase
VVHSPKRALFAAAGLVFTAGVCWLLTFVVPFGNGWDQGALQGFDNLRGARVDHASQTLASLADPAPYIVIGLILVAIALLRGRPRLALVVAFVLSGSSVTTQILKPLLAAHRFAPFLGGAQIANGSWPSGHSTAAMALALCAVFVATPRMRPFVAAGGAAFALAVSFSILILGWHYPSDVFAGHLVAATWTALGISALWAADLRWPERTGREAVARARASLRASEVIAPTALGAGIVAAIGGLIAIERPATALAYMQAHTTFVAFMFALSTLALALASGLALALRR